MPTPSHILKEDRGPRKAEQESTEREMEEPREGH